MEFLSTLGIPSRVKSRSGRKSVVGLTLERKCDGLWRNTAEQTPRRQGTAGKGSIGTVGLCMKKLNAYAKVCMRYGALGCDNMKGLLFSQS